MRHIHIEMIGGLAGDMFLAAALDAGFVTFDGLQKTLNDAGLGVVEVVAERVLRQGISATHVRFEGEPVSQPQPERLWRDIDAMLVASALDAPVRERARSMFRALAEVEARVHGMTPEEVHFHEVGAVDSILDFVGAAYIIERLGASWSTSAAPQGQGMIRTAHGLVPALAPATAHLLERFPLSPREVRGELVTPTGAAILRELKPAWSPPTGVLSGTGFGAGTKDWPGLANVVRLTCYEVDEARPGALLREEVVRLVCEIDDQSAEQLAQLDEVLFSAGALDVVRTAVAMKKGRVGTQLAALALPADAERLARLILIHSTSFGVRVEPVSRYKLERRMITVETPWGAVPAKIGMMDGRAIKGAPEYDACLALSRASGAPLRAVMEAAQAAVVSYLNAQEAT
jgi:pyridinium-3,5-bisthiocarboxylic acid mononucleotide nickel chelatase